MVPMPAIIRVALPGDLERMSLHGILTIRWTSTTTLIALKRYVEYLLHTLSALRPRPLTRKVHATKPSSVTTIRTLLASMPKTSFSTVRMAYAPVTALIVSQPKRATHRIAPGK